MRLDAVNELEAREKATVNAMKAGVPLIYGGRLSAGDLAAEPDLLRLGADGYTPGDIKAGAGEEGSDEDAKPKKRYAVQLALHVDVLERLGFSDGRRTAFVWDVNDDEVPYDLMAPKGKRSATSLWDDYQECLAQVREIVAGSRNPGPAYQGECKHCVWYGACMKRLEELDDLTLLPGLGRSRREGLSVYANTIAELAATDPATLISENGKSIVPGIGAEWVFRFQQRAALKHTNGVAYLRETVRVPRADTELFFDIETDPGRNICYLHGFLERTAEREQYTGFFTASPTLQAERESFGEAVTYARGKMPCTIYTYSKYERTWWRTLQKRYPDVCSRTEIDELFSDANTVDLLYAVQTATEWPTKDHTIKTLARYLGFNWRDPHPSGFASIEWYDRYVAGDTEAKARILEYNEDDCLATRVLLDGIRRLELRGL